MKEYLKSLPSSCSDPLPSFSEFIRNHHYRELLSYVGAIDRDSELTLQIMRRFGDSLRISSISGKQWSLLPRMLCKVSIKTWKFL